jgi:hypothetical protein
VDKYGMGVSDIVQAAKKVLTKERNLIQGE